MDGQKRLYFTITFVKLRLSESASKTNYEHSRMRELTLSNILMNVPITQHKSLPRWSAIHTQLNVKMTLSCSNDITLRCVKRMISFGRRTINYSFIQPL